MTIRSGRVNAWVGKEVTPRRFEQTDATLQLGRDYHSLSVDLTSLVHLRDPDTHKCVWLPPLHPAYLPITSPDLHRFKLCVCPELERKLNTSIWKHVYKLAGCSIANSEGSRVAIVFIATR